MRVPVLLDCDPGIDDALALVYLAGLHHAGEIILTGVTTTAGNTTATQAAVNAAWVLERCGITGVPVAAGRPAPPVVELVTTPETHGETGLGYVTAEGEARGDWEAIWDAALEAHPGLRLIVTGPLTNLAARLRTDPAALTRFADVTVMGGAVHHPGNTTPTAEWNMWVDPHSAAEVFAAAEPAHPVTLCSLAVTERFLVDPGRLERLVVELGNTPVAAELPAMLRFYFEFHDRQGEGYRAQIHDLLTCMVALDTIPSETAPTTVAVEADSPLLRGTTVADLRGHWGREPTARLVRDVDLDAAHAELSRGAGLLAQRHRPD